MFEEILCKQLPLLAGAIVRLVTEGGTLNDLAGIPKSRKNVNPSNYYLEKIFLSTEYNLSTLNDF